MKINIRGDTGQNMAAYTQTLPAGTTLEESSEKAVDAEDALMDIDGVDVVQTTIGDSSFGFGGASNEVTYQITTDSDADQERSEEHTSELQSRGQLVCRLLLVTKNHT